MPSSPSLSAPDTIPPFPDYETGSLIVWTRASRHLDPVDRDATALAVSETVHIIRVTPFPSPAST